MTSMMTEAALALSRWAELSILGKATIMLALGLIAARLAGRARASVRHLLLAATFAALLALPLLTLTIPGVLIEVPASRGGGSTPAAGAAPASVVTPASRGLGRRAPESDGWSAPTWPVLFRAGWIAGAGLLLGSLAVNLWRLRRLRRGGRPWPGLRELTQALAAECGVRRSVEVLVREDIPAPLTCGVRRPAIVLPAEARAWGEADLRRALLHELEHVRRGDWAMQLAARAACACYWFHPLVWMAWRRLGLEAERACDDAVVQRAERTEYAEQLLSLARRLSRPHPQAALGMARRSDLSQRISALLDGSQPRGRAGLWAAAGTLSIAGLLVLAIAPVRAVAQAANPGAAVAREPGSPRGDEGQRRSASLDEALFEAAESGDLSGINRLLDAGANVNCVLDGDGSPLIAAARHGRLAAAQLLLDRGADPNLPVPGDGNPLIMAAREGHAAVVSLLLDRGAGIDEMVPGDENALIQASGEGHLQVVQLLVTRGADVNARTRVERAYERPDGEWRSPLSMARRGGHQAVVAFLLAAGARE